ncbi:WD40 repeat domain-containing protein [Candidatus Dependentiae bacterium]|nr:WD40 repeat domain-containing protein [Candidatus Dependentiae bacterium]
MKKIAVVLLFLPVMISQGAYTARFGDVQFNLKDDQTVIVPQSTFIQLREYSPTINNAAGEVEASANAVKELPFLQVDKDSLKFIVEALKIIQSPGQLIIKLKNYLQTRGANSFSNLMRVVEFFDIKELLNAYDSLPQLKQACPITIKRKEPESEITEPKKLRIEGKQLTISIPTGGKSRERVLKIVKASRVLTDYVRDARKLENIDEIAPGADLLITSISIDHWNLLLELADNIEDFSNDNQVHNALKQYSADRLKDILLIADYLEMARLLDNAIDLLLARLESEEIVFDALAHLGAYDKFFNQITPEVREILKRRILKSELLGKFHWSGPLKIGTDRELSGIAMRPDGLIVAAGINDTHKEKKGIILIDTTTKKISFLASLEFSPDAMQFSPNGNYISTKARIGFSQGLYLMDIKNGNQITVKQASNSASAFSHNNKFLGYIANGRLFTLYDLATNNYDSVFDTWDLSHSSIYSMAFSPNDQTIALGLADGRIFFINLNTKEIIKRLLTEDMKPIESLAFLSEKQLLAKSYEGKMRLWDIEKEKIIEDMSFEYNEAPGWITNPIFSPNGAKIAADYWKEIRIWQVSNPQHYQTIILPQEVWSLVRGEMARHDLISFNGDGSRIAIATRQGVLVWKNIDYQLDKLSIDKVFTLALIKKYHALSGPQKEKVILSQDFEKKITSLPMDIKILVEQYYPKFMSDLKLNK